MTATLHEKDALYMYLFDNLDRATNELYTTIEYDSNSVQCHRAFESLSGWRADFGELQSRLELINQQNGTGGGISERPHGIAWQVRTTSRYRAAPAAARAIVEGLLARMQAGVAVDDSDLDASPRTPTRKTPPPVSPGSASGDIAVSRVTTASLPAAAASSEAASAPPPASLQVPTALAGETRSNGCPAASSPVGSARSLSNNEPSPGLGTRTPLPVRSPPPAPAPVTSELALQGIVDLLNKRDVSWGDIMVPKEGALPPPPPPPLEVGGASVRTSAASLAPQKPAPANSESAPPQRAWGRIALTEGPRVPPKPNPPLQEPLLQPQLPLDRLGAALASQSQYRVLSSVVLAPVRPVADVPTAATAAAAAATAVYARATGTDSAGGAAAITAVTASALYARAMGTGSAGAAAAAVVNPLLTAPFTVAPITNPWLQRPPLGAAAASRAGWLRGGGAPADALLSDLPSLPLLPRAITPPPLLPRELALAAGPPPRRPSGPPPGLPEPPPHRATPPRFRGPPSAAAVDAWPAPVAAAAAPLPPQRSLLDHSEFFDSGTESEGGPWSLVPPTRRGRAGTGAGSVDARPGLILPPPLPATAAMPPGQNLRDKFSSPDRQRPTPQETARRGEERQRIAMLNREAMDRARAERLVSQASRRQGVSQTLTAKTESRKAALDASLSSHAARRDAQLKAVAERAGSDGQRVMEADSARKAESEAARAEYAQRLSAAGERKERAIAGVRERAGEQARRVQLAAEQRRVREAATSAALREGSERRLGEVEERRSELLRARTQVATMSALPVASRRADGAGALSYATMTKGAESGTAVTGAAVVQAAPSAAAASAHASAVAPRAQAAPQRGGAAPAAPAAAPKPPATTAFKARSEAAPKPAAAAAAAAHTAPARSLLAPPGAEADPVPKPTIVSPPASSPAGAFLKGPADAGKPAVPAEDGGARGVSLGAAVAPPHAPSTTVAAAAQDPGLLRAGYEDSIAAASPAWGAAAAGCATPAPAPAEHAVADASSSAPASPPRVHGAGGVDPEDRLPTLVVANDTPPRAPVAQPHGLLRPPSCAGGLAAVGGSSPSEGGPLLRSGLSPRLPRLPLQQQLSPRVPSIATHQHVAASSVVSIVPFSDVGDVRAAPTARLPDESATAAAALQVGAADETRPHASSAAVVQCAPQQALPPGASSSSAESAKARRKRLQKLRSSLTDAAAAACRAGGISLEASAAADAAAAVAGGSAAVVNAAAAFTTALRAAVAPGAASGAAKGPAEAAATRALLELERTLERLPRPVPLGRRSKPVRAPVPAPPLDSLLEATVWVDALAPGAPSPLPPLRPGQAAAPAPPAASSTLDEALRFADSPAPAPRAGSRPGLDLSPALLPVSSADCAALRATGALDSALALLRGAPSAGGGLAAVDGYAEWCALRVVGLACARPSGREAVLLGGGFPVVAGAVVSLMSRAVALLRSPGGAPGAPPPPDDCACALAGGCVACRLVSAAPADADSENDPCWAAAALQPTRGAGFRPLRVACGALMAGLEVLWAVLRHADLDAASPVQASVLSLAAQYALAAGLVEAAAALVSAAKVCPAKAQLRLSPLLQLVAAVFVALLRLPLTPGAIGARLRGSAPPEALLPPPGTVLSAADGPPAMGEPLTPPPTPVDPVLAAARDASAPLLRSLEEAELLDLPSLVLSLLDAASVGGGRAGGGGSRQGAASPAAGSAAPLRPLHQPSAAAAVGPQPQVAVVECCLASLSALTHCGRLDLALVQRLCGPGRLWAPLHHALDRILAAATAALDASSSASSSSASGGGGGSGGAPPPGGSGGAWAGVDRRLLDALIREALLLLGQLALDSPGAQDALRWGVGAGGGGASASLLGRLCELPFRYFSQAAYRAELYPTLILAGLHHEANRRVIASHLSCGALASFLRAASDAASSKGDADDDAGGGAEAYRHVLPGALSLTARVPPRLWGPAIAFYGADGRGGGGAPVVMPEPSLL